ncbi:MAG: L-rhamnose/proton symporter RhaT [Verrucomicrobiae bacterium]|nr:L-rhamnose/proton symporter RhaT [Verrucomicrobiae bacterium]
MIPANPLLGIAFHAVGAISAALCYTPQKATRFWSWQTYWLAQASVCWIILPVLVAWLTIPEIGTVLSLAPRGAMVHAFLLGALYGVGGTAFGLAIRHIGFSLTYAVAIGISCVLGTLVPPLLSGQLLLIFEKTGASWVLSGIAIGVLGILVSGWAGRLKELDLAAQGGVSTGFDLRRGLPLVILAGVLSAVYGMALAAGQPIADEAARHGAGVFQGNIIYIFSNSGAFLTTALYSLWLHTKHKTLGEYVELPGGTEKSALARNFAMALLTGCLWYGQFFFYGLGHVRMGSYEFSSWAIHMILLVLFSAFSGLFLREWSGCRPRTWMTLGLAIGVLIAAVLVLTYGNFLGDAVAGH